MNKFTKILLSLLLLTSITWAKDNTQTELKSLKSTLESYRALNLKGELAKTLDYTYDAAFKKVSKEQLLESFKMLKKANKIPEITALNYTTEGAIKTFSKGFYTLVPYTMEMRMDMTPPVDKSNKEEYAQLQKMLNNPKELQAYKDFSVNMLKMSMGKDSKVVPEENSLKINISKKGKFLMIDEDKKGWKFVETDPKSLSVIKEFLPKEIVEQEKELFSVKAPSKEEQYKEMMKLMQKAQEAQASEGSKK